MTAGTAWAVISCKAGVSCYGTSGPDELHGTKKKNYLYGKEGNDTLLGRRGNDYLAGDGPIDTGADGNDQLYGGAGADTFKAGKGNDIIEAKDNHKDTINCGSGKDEVWFDLNLDQVAANCEEQHPE
jgi:Ca2+-binding RTX toxin-like protein